MRQMWLSWSTPSTGRYLFLSQAHYQGCHESQVGFWNVGRNLHGGKGAHARKKSIELTRGARAWCLGWMQSQAWGWGKRGRGTTRLRCLLSPNVLSFHCCTSTVLANRQNLKLVQKDGFLISILPLFFPSDFIPLSYFPELIAEVF